MSEKLRDVFLRVELYKSVPVHLNGAQLCAIAEFVDVVVAGRSRASSTCGTAAVIAAARSVCRACGGGLTLVRQLAYF
jgi:hypothetical protein